MKDEEKKVLVGFHSFTGNDYIPAIFTKGKKHCWSTMKSNESFLRAFTELGADWDMTEQQVNAIEQYVCALYKSKRSQLMMCVMICLRKNKTKKAK